MSIAISILGLAFLILIHEAGHFYTSLAVGMRPRGFSIGFGPPLVKVRRRGIDYAIRVIPLGGYVKIPGMHRPAAKDVDVVFAHALHESPELVGPAERLKRSLAAEDFVTAREQLAEFSARAHEVGATRIDRGINDLQDALAPEAYWRQSTWRRIAVIIAGPATNLAFAVVLFAIVFMVAAGKTTTNVVRVLPDSPARAAGLQRGDSVTAIGVQGSPMRPVTASQISDRINGSRGRPVTLEVRRGNDLVVLRAQRSLRQSDGSYRLGFQLDAEPLAFGPASWKALKTTGIVSRDTIAALGGIFNKKDRKQISSGVGITQGLSDSVHYGWASYLGVLGFISLSLGLLNLLPLLPLDGGHIAFAILEGIRGRAIAREIYERVSAVGIAVVLLLFFIGLSNDVGRLGGG